MARRSQSFEGVANGAAFSTSNTNNGGYPVQTYRSNTNSDTVATTSGVGVGVVAALSTAQSGVITAVNMSAFGVKAEGFAALVWLEPNFTGAVAAVRNSTTRVMTVSQTAGKVKFSSSSADRYTTTQAVTTRGMYWIDVMYDVGTSTTDGKLRGIVRDFDGNPALGMTDYFESTGQNLGGGTMPLEVRAGAVGTEATVRTVQVERMETVDSYSSAMPVAAPPPAAGPTLVGYVSNDGTGLATTRTLTRPTTAGNLLVAYVQHQSNTSATISDNTGGEWTLAATTNTAGAISQRLASIFYRLNAPATSSVTVSMSTSSALNVVVEEYSGLNSYIGSGVAIYGGSSTVQSAGPSGTIAAEQLVCSLVATFNAAPVLQTSEYTTPVQLGTGTIFVVTHLMPSGNPPGTTPRWTAANSFGLANAVFSTEEAPPYAPPSANAGPDQSGVEPYSTVQLTANGSTAGTNPITGYAWGPPSPNTAVLSSTTSATPTLTIPGSVSAQSYVVPLTVTDGTTVSTADSVTINALPNTETSWDANGTEIPVQWVTL